MGVTELLAKQPVLGTLGAIIAALLIAYILKGLGSAIGSLYQAFRRK